MITVEYAGKRIDQAPEDLPGYYFALQDILDLSAIKGSRSTTCKLPASNQVRDAMGGPSMAEEVDIEEQPYRVLTGTSVLFSGRAKVLSRSAEEYTLQAIGDNAAWKDAAANLQLRDIELGNTPYNVTRLTQMATWEDTDSIVTFPVMSFGLLKSRDNSFNVQPSMLRPGTRIWLLLKKGFQQIGYSIQAYRSLNATWKNFVLPCTTSKCFSVATTVADVALRMYRTPGTSYAQSVSIPSDPIPDEVNFDLFTGSFYAVPGRYEPTADGFVAVSARIQWGIDLWTGPTLVNGGFTGTMTYVLYDYTDSVIKASVSLVFTGDTSSQFSPSFSWPTIETVAGHSYGIGMYSAQSDYMNSGSILGGFTVNAVTIYDATESNWLADKILYTADHPLIINTALPEDMSLLDLLKWWTTEECIAIRTDELTHHIRLEYYDDFCRPTSEGIDWSYRVDHTDPPRKVTDVLPKSYQFRYKDDGKDQLVDIINRSRTGAPYGGYDHAVTGGMDSPASVDIGFAPTAMDTILGGQLLVPCLYDNTEEPDAFDHIPDQFDWEPRILYMDGLADGGWKYNGVTETQYPRCYFVWPEQGRNNLSFGNEALSGSVTPGTVVTRWRNRLRRSTAPVFEGRVKIHDGELMGIDFGVPRYMSDGIHGNWFYFLEIQRHQFLSEGTTEARFVRV